MSGLGAVVGALAVAGCGSAPEEAFLREANGICAAAHERLAEIPEPSSLAEVRKTAEEEIAIREEAIAELEKLTPPRAIEGGAIAVFGDLEIRQEHARALKKAAEEKDEAKLRELEHEVRTKSGHEVDRAKAIGLHDCAEL